jgi:hypothetical protein
MNKEFVKYEQALALKELGFDERCFGGYEKDFSNKYFRFRGASETDIYMKNSDFKITSTTVCAPLYQQAFRWFREKHDKYGVVNIDLSNNLKDKIFVYMVEDKLGYFIDRSEEYNTYEEAESACLDKLVELVKTK